MAIRIARGARTGWREGNLVFVIHSKAETADLLAALSEVGGPLMELDDDEGGGPRFVSDPVVLPGGVAFWIDSGDVAPAMADRIVATIAEGLEARGIDGRLVGGGRLDLRRPSHLPRVALSAVPGHPPATDALAVIPWDEICRALDWVIDDATRKVVVLSGGVRLDLPPASAGQLVAFFHRSGRSYDVLVTGPTEWRECSVGHPADRRRGDRCPHLSLARSGYDVAADVDAAFEVAIGRGRTVGAWAASVFVDVEPDPQTQVSVRPWWNHATPDADARLALTDHVLDAFPWQRVHPEQVRSLPDPPNRLLSHDRDTGELRMGRLDHWLREKVTARTDFLTAMRTLLGHALATRDVAWERYRMLPTAVPRPAGEPLGGVPDVDLDHVPIESQTKPHPSLGVTPIELLSLRRGGGFGEALDLSAPLRTWLRLLADGVAWQDRADLRWVVDALVEADLGDQRAMAHRELLADCAVCGLTPVFVETAGLGDAAALRERLATAAEGTLSDTLAVLWEVLAAVVVRDRGAGEPVMTGGMPAARTSAALAAATSRASATGRLSAGSADLAVRRVLSMADDGSPFSDEVADVLWSEAVLATGTDAVEEAFERAAVAKPRVAHLWREAEAGPHRWCVLEFKRAAAPALFDVDDPMAAWDAAVERGRAAVPGYWRPLNESLAQRLPREVVEAGWANARRTMARTHARTRLVAANAVTGAVATMICRMIAGQAADAGWDEALRDVAWTAMDDLCANLAADR